MHFIYFIRETSHIEACNLRRASTKANPNKFFPNHFAGVVAFGSFFAIPIPHIRSLGLASTSIFESVAKRYANNSGFCENL